MRPTSINAAMIAALMAAAAAIPGAKVIVGGDTEPTARAATTTDQQPVKKAGEQRVTDRRTTPFLRTISGGYTGADFRRASPGWTNRHVQRMAVKKRNRARHRKACRG